MFAVYDPCLHISTLCLILDNLSVLCRISAPSAYEFCNSTNNCGSFTSLATDGYTTGDNPVLKFKSSLGPQFTLGSVGIYDTASAVPDVAHAATSSSFNNQCVGFIDEEFTLQGGWSTSVVRLSGLPAGAVFTLELVYHIEGVPNCNNHTLMSSAKYPIYRPELLEVANATAAKLPWWRRAGISALRHLQANSGAYLQAGATLATALGQPGIGMALSSMI